MLSHASLWLTPGWLRIRGILSQPKKLKLGSILSTDFEEEVEKDKEREGEENKRMRRKKEKGKEGIGGEH